MLQQTVSSQSEVKPGDIYVTGRSGSAADLYRGNKRERKPQEMATWLLLMANTFPGLPQAAVPHPHQVVDNKL